MESGCCCFFITLFFPFFFLSNFQTLKFFVTLFSGTVRPRRLKIGTHMDNEWMYQVYRNQAAAAYLSLYFIFLSLQFSNIKIFCHTFLRNCEAWKIETLYTCGEWVDLSCIQESGCCCLFVPSFLACLYISTGRAIAVTSVSLSASALLKMLKFLKACISWTCGWI